MWTILVVIMSVHTCAVCYFCQKIEHLCTVFMSEQEQNQGLVKYVRMGIVEAFPFTIKNCQEVYSFCLLILINIRSVLKLILDLIMPYSSKKQELRYNMVLIIFFTKEIYHSYLSKHLLIYTITILYIT